MFSSFFLPALESFCTTFTSTTRPPIRNDRLVSPPLSRYSSPVFSPVHSQSLRSPPTCFVSLDPVVPRPSSFAGLTPSPSLSPSDSYFLAGQVLLRFAAAAEAHRDERLLGQLHQQLWSIKFVPSSLSSLSFPFQTDRPSFFSPFFSSATPSLDSQVSTPSLRTCTSCWMLPSGKARRFFLVLSRCTSTRLSTLPFKIPLRYEPSIISL